MNREDVHLLSQSALFQSQGYEACLETHISWLLICKEFVYKIKKSISLSFIDYSTLANRKNYCEEELRLNKQYSPDIYLKVISIRKKTNTFFMDGNAPVVEYAVVMRRLESSYLLTNIFSERRDFEKEELQRIAKRVYHIHKHAKCSSLSFNQKAFITRIRQITFLPEQVMNTYSTAEKKLIDYLVEASIRFLNRNIELFKARIELGHVRSTHGDLHAGNVFLYPDEIYLIDCIEFKEEYRTIDILDDLATLLIDFEVLSLSTYATRIEKEYLQSYTELPWPYHKELLIFYKIQKAFTRFSTHAISGEVNNILLSRKYLKLAAYYADDIN